MDEKDIADTAAVVIEQHGARAGQFVVDKIVAALRAGDDDQARRWNIIGQAVERQSVRPSI